MEQLVQHLDFVLIEELTKIRGGGEFSLWRAPRRKAGCGSGLAVYGRIQRLQE